MVQMLRNDAKQTHAQEAVRLRTGREVPDLLRELYIDRRRTQVEIAAELGVSRLTVARWLREFGIVQADGQVA